MLGKDLTHPLFCWSGEDGPNEKWDGTCCLMMGKCHRIWAAPFQRFHGDISVSLLHGQRKEKDTGGDEQGGTDGGAWLILTRRSGASWNHH